MTTHVRQTVLTVGENRNNPRIWIEGLYLKKAGFDKGCKVSVNFGKDTILIEKSHDGDKLVSGKEGKAPIIDINNSSILQVFNIADKIKVVVEMGRITISRSKILLRKLKALKNKTCGSVFSGAGLLDEVMKRCGFETKWGIEVNEKYAEMWQENHSGVMHNMSVEEVDIESLEQVEVITGGVPCENFSQVRQNKNVEAETVDMSLFFFNLIERINPRTIILEEVPQYLKSEIGVATINALKRLGYNVESKVFSGNEYGMVQNRKRLILIASYDKINWPDEQTFSGNASDILQNPDDPECKWFTLDEKPYIKQHWENAKAKGNNFIAQLVTPETTSIQAITRRYNAIQPANPFVKHPTEDKYRLFSMTELRRLFGLSDDYYLGNYPTYAGEALGQGVLVKAFKIFVDAMFYRSEK